jgi:hypothetical protein
LIVQCTTLGNVSSRLSKAREQGELQTWLRAGGRVEVHGWTAAGKVKRVEIRADDLANVIIAKPGRKLRGWHSPDLFVI